MFKVFVANPNKPPQIAAILKRNKEKLLSFLKDFHNDREGECAVAVPVCAWAVVRSACLGIGPVAGRLKMTSAHCLLALVLVRESTFAQGPFEVSCTCRASSQIGLCRIPAVPVFSYQAMTIVPDRVQGLAHPSDEPDLRADIRPCSSWLHFGLPAEIRMLTLPTQTNNSPTRSNSSLGRSRRCSRRTFLLHVVVIVMAYLSARTLRSVLMPSVHETRPYAMISLYQ